jgi:tRNA modification GTPase
VNEIVRARTDRARALALHRLAGSVEGRIRELKQRLLELEAAVEVRLDYPEEDLPGELAPEAELDGRRRAWRAWPPPTASGACTRKG